MIKTIHFFVSLHFFANIYPFFRKNFIFLLDIKTRICIIKIGENYTKCEEMTMTTIFSCPISMAADQIKACSPFCRLLTGEGTCLLAEALKRAHKNDIETEDENL